MSKNQKDHGGKLPAGFLTTILKGVVMLVLVVIFANLVAFYAPQIF